MAMDFNQSVKLLDAVSTIERTYRGWEFKDAHDKGIEWLAFSNSTNYRHDTISLLDVNREIFETVYGSIRPLEYFLEEEKKAGTLRDILFKAGIGFQVSFSDKADIGKAIYRYKDTIYTAPQLVVELVRQGEIETPAGLNKILDTSFVPNLQSVGTGTIEYASYENTSEVEPATMFMEKIGLVSVRDNDVFLVMPDSYGYISQTGKFGLFTSIEEYKGFIKDLCSAVSARKN